LICEAILKNNVRKYTSAFPDGSILIAKFREEGLRLQPLGKKHGLPALKTQYCQFHKYESKFYSQSSHTSLEKKSGVKIGRGWYSTPSQNVASRLHIVWSEKFSTHPF